MSEYFPEPYKPFEGNNKVELDKSNYSTKANLKRATGMDTSYLKVNLYLASLIAEVDKIDIDKCP